MKGNISLVKANNRKGSRSITQKASRKVKGKKVVKSSISTIGEERHKIKTGKILCQKHKMWWGV